MRHISDKSGYEEWRAVGQMQDRAVLEERMRGGAS